MYLCKCNPRTMEEKKRLTATKAAIAKFREEHPSYTDEHLASLVENTYPKLYEDSLEVSIEIVKELYRKQESWTDESFVTLLKEMTEGRKLVRFGIEERKNARVIAKVNPFIERLYKEAQERTIYLSECPEYKDEDIKQYFEGGLYKKAYNLDTTVLSEKITNLIFHPDKTNTQNKLIYCLKNYLKGI